MIIGICGGSGSGKTTLLKRIAKQYAALTPTVFSMDNYYLTIDKQALDVNGKVNFDLPTALDTTKLFYDLTQLKLGNSIEVKEYHFNAPPNKNVLITLDPSSLIIVEGLFVFHYEEVGKLLDFSIFVDVDDQIQLDRRIYRDQETRGYTQEDIIYQWNNHVIPCFEKYLKPYVSTADFIFDNNHHSDQEFERLISAIEPKLACLNC